MLLLELVGFFAAVFLAVFLFPSGSLLNTPNVLLRTSWFFFYQYIAFYRSKIHIYIYIYIYIPSEYIYYLKTFSHA